jgi:amino acid transporter
MEQRENKLHETARLNRTFGTITMLLLVTTAFLAFLGKWIAADLTEWQTMNLSMESHKYQPAIIMFILLMPPLLLLLPVKIYLLKRINHRFQVQH